MKAAYLGYAVGFAMAAGSLLATPAFGWGKTGHELVNATAADLMRSPARRFFQANKTALQKIANTPDTLWKRPPNGDAEGPTHFFHWDRYGRSPIADGISGFTLSQALTTLGDTFVKDNGSAVWRTSGLYKMLVAAIRTQDWKRTLQLAGVLGHYVGDMSQPMHASSDYDGQSIGRSGVHRYFEATLLERTERNDVLAGAQEIGAERREALEHDRREDACVPYVRSLVLAEGQASHDDLSGIYDMFEERSQDDDGLRTYFGPRVGDGAAVLAKIWDTAVEEADVSRGFPGEALTVQEPAFIPLQEERLEDR
jgi:hypothetical protein